MDASVAMPTGSAKSTPDLKNRARRRQERAARESPVKLWRATGPWHSNRNETQKRGRQRQLPASQNWNFQFHKNQKVKTIEMEVAGVTLLDTAPGRKGGYPLLLLFYYALGLLVKSHAKPEKAGLEKDGTSSLECPEQTEPERPDSVRRLPVVETIGYALREACTDQYIVTRSAGTLRWKPMLFMTRMEALAWRDQNLAHCGASAFLPVRLEPAQIDKLRAFIAGHKIDRDFCAPQRMRAFSRN
jgi:hypothetical protein